MMVWGYNITYDYKHFQMRETLSMPRASQQKALMCAHSKYSVAIKTICQHDDV